MWPKWRYGLRWLTFGCERVRAAIGVAGQAVLDEVAEVGSGLVGASAQGNVRVIGDIDIESLQDRVDVGEVDIAGRGIRQRLIEARGQQFLHELVESGVELWADRTGRVLAMVGGDLDGHDDIALDLHDRAIDGIDQLLTPAHEMPLVGAVGDDEHGIASQFDGDLGRRAVADGDADVPPPQRPDRLGQPLQHEAVVASRGSGIVGHESEADE